MLLSRLSPLLNVLITYASWFGVAILAADGKPILALLPSLAGIGFHFLLSEKNQLTREFKILIIAGLLGFIVETFFLFLGVIEYPSGSLVVDFAAPLFMVGLWMAFATSLNTSLFWLQQHLFLSAVLGFLASGPSYYAGEKLGALSLPYSLPWSFGVVGSAWAVVLPLLLFLARRL